MDIKIPGPGETVIAALLHAGDHVAVHDPDAGTLEAVVKAIRDTPDPVRGGGDHELSWESLDHAHTGCLHFSPLDLVCRLRENRSVVLA